MNKEHYEQLCRNLRFANLDREEAEKRFFEAVDTQVLAQDTLKAFLKATSTNNTEDGKWNIL